MTTRKSASNLLLNGFKDPTNSTSTENDLLELKGQEIAFILREEHLSTIAINDGHTIETQNLLVPLSQKKQSTPASKGLSNAVQHTYWK